MARETLPQKLGFTSQFKSYVGAESGLVVDNKKNLLMRKSVQRLERETIAQIEAMPDEIKRTAFAEAANIFADLGERSRSRWFRRGLATPVATTAALLVSPYLAAAVGIVTGVRTGTEVIRANWFKQVSEGFSQRAQGGEIYHHPFRREVAVNAKAA